MVQDFRTGLVDYWHIERELEGQTVVLVGGGPSLADVDLEPLRGRLTIFGMNNAYQKAPWCEYLFFADARWAHWHEDGLKHYQGVLLTTAQPITRPLPDSIRERARVVKNVKAPQWLWTTPPVMCRGSDAISGADSGALAIDLAVHMGAKRLILLGYDMKFKDGRTHWHPDHPMVTQLNTYTRRYLPQHPRIKAAADRLGVVILNATEGSAIECYPRIKLEEALEYASK